MRSCGWWVHAKNLKILIFRGQQGSEEFVASFGGILKAGSGALAGYMHNAHSAATRITALSCRLKKITAKASNVHAEGCCEGSGAQRIRHQRRPRLATLLLILLLQAFLPSSLPSFATTAVVRSISIILHGQAFEEEEEEPATDIAKCSHLLTRHEILPGKFTARRGPREGLHLLRLPDYKQPATRRVPGTYTLTRSYSYHIVARMIRTWCHSTKLYS